MDSTENQKPESRKSKGRIWLAVLGAFVVLAAVIWWVVLPSLKLEGDPTAKGPDINRVDSDGSDLTNVKRGATSDLLFEKPKTPPSHPLDIALEVAAIGLKKVQAEITDYTALLVKQEEVNGSLVTEEYMRIKVRHSNVEKGINKAFYVRHVKPEKMAGQEAIWVQNENDGKLVAHGTGLARFVTVNLKPDSMLAMRGNRYPITELGIETLLMRMIERGTRSQTDPDCKVEYDRTLKLDGRLCTLITITHPIKKENLDFHIAKIYIDDELDLTVGYEGYLWPKESDGEPRLIERYFYRELELNPGLKPSAFDSQNPDYDY